MLNQTEDTPLSLLARLRENDQVAWSLFTARYGKILKRWCASWGIQSSDTDDIVQDTLLIMMSRIPQFEHRGVGSFRAWLKTISWRCWCDILARAHRGRHVELEQSLQSSPQAFETLEAEFDRLIMQELLQICMESVKRRVEPKTWDAFHLTAIESLPAGVVAERLGMNVDAVYAARCRVQRWIGKEYARIDENPIAHPLNT